MKLRMFLTLLLLALWGIAIKILGLVYAPITAVASAQTVNDDVGSYATAKFIREGGIQSILAWSLLLAMILIWFLPFRKSSNKTAVN